MEMQKVQTPLLEKVLHPVQLPGTQRQYVSQCPYRITFHATNGKMPFMQKPFNCSTVHAVMQYTQTSVPCRSTSSHSNSTTRVMSIYSGNIDRQ